MKSIEWICRRQSLLFTERQEGRMLEHILPGHNTARHIVRLVQFRLVEGVRLTGHVGLQHNLCIQISLAFA